MLLAGFFQIRHVHNCDHLSENPSQLSNSFLALSALSKEWFAKILASKWFGISALESRESKEIDLYSDYTKNKLQVLTFVAITSVWISLQS